MSGTEELRRAEALLDMGRYEGAAEHLAPYLAKHPQDAQAWTMLARSFHHRDDAAGALWAADEALKADPAHEPAWRVRSALLSGMGRHTESVAAAEESVRLEPAFYPARLTLAQARSNGTPGDSRAYEAAVHAVRLAPDEAETHYTVGVISHQAGNFVVAEQAYRVALGIDPQHGQAHNNLAVLESRPWQRGRTGAVFEGLARAAAADPQDTLVRHNLEATALGIVAKARWTALLCLVIGMVGAASSGIGDGDPPQPGALGPRLGALVLIAVVLGVWGVRVRRLVPERLREPLLILVRRSVPVRLVAGGCALMSAAAVAAVAVPLTEPGLLGLVTLVVWVAVSLFWAGQIAIRRRSGPVPGSAGVGPGG